MGDIHYIVDKLSAPPFKYTLTLLSFSEKSPQELLQLLTDVFAQISPKHKKATVANETQDQTADRLLTFLKTVKYKPPGDPASFRQQLVSGEKETIYQVLKWVVPQPNQLEKRAFVGYYMSFPDMPDEFNYDPDIMELRDEMKQMQMQFAETHRASEAVKALNKDMQAVKLRIKGLEDEKERLTDKVERAKNQVDKVPDRASYMDVCTSLRKQQDEEVSLSQSLTTQKAQLEKAETAHHKVMARLREMQANSTEGNATKLLETVKDDVTNLRFQVSERGPKDLEKRQKRSGALQEALANGINSESDLQRLSSQASSLHSQIQEGQERRAQADKSRQGDKAYLQLRQAQQMASMAAKRKEEVTAKMERLQEKKANLTKELDKMSSEGGHVVSEEEWRLKFESMKSKLPGYKKMKKELGDIEAEVYVLSYTEELLAVRESAYLDHVKKIEKKQGIAGFSELTNTLEKVSEAKSMMDEAKGMTLAEISRTVEDINSRIQDRKNQLAPQIKKLRLMRQQFAELETDYNDKKSSYDSTLATYEAKNASLDQEVGLARLDIGDNETKFHLLSAQRVIQDAHIKTMSGGPTAELLKTKLQDKIKTEEDLSKTLRDHQRNIKETHTTGLSQIDMMTDLVKMLTAKLELMKNPYASLGAMDGGEAGMEGMGGPGMASGEYKTPTANVFVM